MIEYNLEKQLSDLLSDSDGAKYMEDLFRDIIVHDILCSVLDKEPKTVIDMPRIGKIEYCYHTDGKMEYAFLPSASFKKALVEAMRTGESPINTRVAGSVQRALNRAYKELL